ncbi:hypothetical protein EFB08_13980 [Rufibacter latericius]|uniref:Uncharacterized protein n=1 Tax=Rufibacter latericius TaxID=2487040 RepID=A0A3M9MKC8_9BACT|nr:hypothetical protein EFB08_13980 [Rufibacter latericius]
MLILKEIRITLPLRQIRILLDRSPFPVFAEVRHSCALRLFLEITLKEGIVAADYLNGAKPSGPLPNKSLQKGELR